MHYFAALTRSNAANYVGAVFDHLLGMEGPIPASDTLDDYFVFLSKIYCHVISLYKLFRPFIQFPNDQMESKNSF